MLEGVQTAPKVFISYSWDCPEHKDRVLLLANSLKKYGIDSKIDRYQQAPPEGWYRWMMNQIDESDFVLIVCTEKYNLRYRNKAEQGQGRGVTWEGGLIIAELYDGQGINDKYIPVLLSPDGEKYIPRSLQAYTVYRLFDEQYDAKIPGEFQNLYRHLSKQPEYEEPKLGKRIILPPIQPAPSNVGIDGAIVKGEDIANELASDRGVNYTQLEELLKAGEWEKADQETADRMREVMGRLTGSFPSNLLYDEDIEKFPCTDLRTINQLWVKYSKGRFGFSVQQKLYLDCGAKLDGKYPGDKIFNEFCVRIGWFEYWEKRKELTFDISATPGHLPTMPPFYRTRSVTNRGLNPPIVNLFFNIPNEEQWLESSWRFCLPLLLSRKDLKL
ncbi:MAG: TIR domain-containing protein [Cyanobacteria bacterium RU_5_0]|nr:TIR domain-containing protein [Cyanobacteria bacterium RU_5_0]